MPWVAMMDYYCQLHFKSISFVVAHEKQDGRRVTGLLS